jgi:hypothetical protein
MNDDLLDLLAALEHDLGKHLALPVTMLPASATPGALADAVRAALTATRTVRGRRTSARELWQAFTREAGPLVRRATAFVALAGVVERALAWEARLDEPVDRAAVLRDFAAVKPAIRALTKEVQRG